MYIYIYRYVCIYIYIYNMRVLLNSCNTHAISNQVATWHGRPCIMLALEANQQAHHYLDTLAIFLAVGCSLIPTTFMLIAFVTNLHSFVKGGISLWFTRHGMDMPLTSLYSKDMLASACTSVDVTHQYAIIQLSSC